MSDNQEYNDIVNNIIVGIAYRSSYKFKGLDVDDLIQELWVKVLTAEKEKGYQLDFNFIARICYDKIVDIQRSEMIRNHYNLGDNYDINENHFSWDDIENSLLIKQLYETFPRGTKESIFLEYWMESVGMKDYGYRPEGSYLDGYSETNLSIILGFSGTSDSRYKKFRNYMRERVKEFITE